jgi:antitoxin component YwqK of YwqJK toxin-antitoxin module
MSNDRCKLINKNFKNLIAMKNLTALLIGFFFTTLAIANPTNVVNLGDDEVKVASIEATTQKKAGQVVYNCGSTPCNGVVKSLHDNGQVQIKGTFENGIAVDTVKEFADNGQMIRLFHPCNINGFEQQFYADGQLKREYINGTNECTYYYNDGKVWLKYTNNEIGQRSDVVQFYENGQTRLAQKGNTQTAYYPNGKIAAKCKRSVANKMDRAFGETVVFYNYEFTTYTESGIEVTTAKFSGTDMDYKCGFPLSLNDVTDFESVIYFDEAGKAAKKEEFTYISNTKVKKVTYISQFGKWNAIESTTK